MTEVLIGAVVVALVDAIKDLAPRVKGVITVLVAAIVGGLIAALDQELGFQTDLSVAEGVLVGLAAAGTVGVAKRIG